MLSFVSADGMEETDTLVDSNAETQYLRVPADPVNAAYISRNVATGEVQYTNLAVPADSATINANGLVERYAPAYFPESTIDEIDLYKIISSDDREPVTPKRTVLPYCAIGVIEITFENSSKPTYGTAWMFYGKVAVTAGHCVYDERYGGWAKTIKFYAGPNGTKSSATATANMTTMHTSNLWIASAQTKDDWAVIELDSDVAATTGYLGLYYTTGNMTGKTVELSGYPVDHMWKQYKMQGPITKCEEAAIYYTIDTEGGQSGAPVFLPGDNYVVGIHHGGTKVRNEGARITPSLFDYLMSFRK